MQKLKVSKNSYPKKVACAIVATYKKGEENIVIQAIGAKAVNQCIKAVVIAKGMLAPNGVNLLCEPCFVDVELDGEKRTGMKFKLVFQK